MTPSLRKRQPDVTLFASWLLCLLIHPLNVFAATAARSDWAPIKGQQCRGSYQQPVVDPDQNDNTIHASAGSALSVRDHSTPLVGDIHVKSNNQVLKADFATIDAATERYTADGNVSLRQPDLLLRGDHISGSLFSATAVIDSASFLLHKSRVRGTATQVSKRSNGDLSIEHGRFTTCEPEANTWAVNGSSIRLHPSEGYGIARNATLEIKDIPIAYFPYFRFPIDGRRQTGLLMPSAGRDSDGGTDIALPYYLNLKENLDATYTLRSIWKRGVMHEAEMRYLNQSSMNTIAMTYLPSDDIYDGRDIIGIDGREDEDRWLAHINHLGRWGRWSSRVNFTSVSDIDYLHDLGGFTATKTQLDRALSESDSPALLRTGALQYGRDNWQATLEMRSFQELSQLQPQQYAVLPQLSVAAQHNLSTATLTTKFQLTEFDRSGEVTDGSRLVLDSRLALPLRKPWGFLTPAARVIYRDYNLNSALAGSEDSASLTTSIASIDTGLIFERDTKIRGQRIRQTLEPRLFYLYAEEDFQDNLPSFDSSPLTPSFDNLFREVRFTGYDRVGDANQIALGVTTNYYSVKGQKLVSASLGQRYYLKDRAVTFGVTPGIDSTNETSPLFAAMATTLGPVSVTASYEFDTDANRSNRGFFSLKYRRDNNAVFNFTYTMTEQSIQRSRLARDEEETDLSFIWPLAPAWQIIGRWNYGWGKRQTIESLLGVEYNDCCWRARIVFRRNLEEPRVIGLSNPGVPIKYVIDRRADSGIYFEFQLKGLASLGGRLDSLIHDAIPGFIAR